MYGKSAHETRKIKTYHTRRLSQIGFVLVVVECVVIQPVYFCKEFGRDVVRYFVEITEQELTEKYIKVLA